MSRAISNPFVTNDENNDYDDVNTENDDLIVKKGTDKNNFYVNDTMFTRAWFVTVLTALIMAVLIMGIINLYQATEIIYGTIGFWTFRFYYIIHVGWYAIFLIIHLFLGTTQLFYTMNRMNYIDHIIINYGHIWYINFIKLFFGGVLVAMLYINNDSTYIPLYYNLIVIETILSSILISLTNELVININTIKLIHIASSMA